MKASGELKGCNTEGPNCTLFPLYRALDKCYALGYIGNRVSFGKETESDYQYIVSIVREIDVLKTMAVIAVSPYPAPVTTDSTFLHSTFRPYNSYTSFSH